MEKLQNCRDICTKPAVEHLTHSQGYLREKELWLDYLRSFVNSETIRTSVTKLAVANQTTFRWRDRFLE